MVLNAHCNQLPVVVCIGVNSCLQLAGRFLGSVAIDWHLLFAVGWVLFATASLQLVQAHQGINV
jgi:uncharacterized membrane protein